MFGRKNVGIQLPIAKITSMEEILHHLGCIKLWKLWDKLLINCFDLFHQQYQGKGYEIATHTLHGLLTSDCAWSTAPFLKKCCTLVVSFPKKKILLFMISESLLQMALLQSFYDSIHPSHWVTNQPHTIFLYPTHHPSSSFLEVENPSFRPPCSPPPRSSRALMVSAVWRLCQMGLP